MFCRCLFTSIGLRFALTRWVLVLLLVGCSNQHAASPEPAAGAPVAAPAVVGEPFTVTAVPWTLKVKTQGSLVADEVSEIGVEVPGVVEHIHAELGDKIAAGAILVTLQQREYELSIAQAAAQLLQARAAVGLNLEESMESLNVENAPPVRQERALWEEVKARLKRVNRLNTNDAIAQETVESTIAEEQAAEARYLAAGNAVREKIALVAVRQVELDQARSRLERTIVRAPFAGQVLRRHVGAGSYVSVSDPIVTLVRSNPLWFRGTIPERYAHQLKLGQEVLLQVESVPQPFTVKITRISPSLDELSRALTYEAQVDNADEALRTGLFSVGEILLDPTAVVIAIPRTGIREFAGVERVWKIVANQPQEQIVETGERRAELVEITAGLATGDTILLPLQQPVDAPATALVPEG